MNIKTNWIRVIIFCYIPQLSFAEPLLIDINPVKVTATRVEKNIIDIPASVSYISQEKIQLGAEQVGLDESMTQVPGAFLLNSYNYAQDLRVSIRGFGARSSFGIRGIKIIIDGIPESLPDGQGSIDGVDIGSIHQISVIRGPSSSLYGNASGGAILIDTERGSESPFIELQDIYGGFNLNKKQFKIGGEINKLNYLLNISDTSVDGYREHSEFKNKQFNGRFEYSLTDSSSIISTVHHTDQPLANDPGGVIYEDFLVNPKQARTQNLNFKAGEKIKQTRIGLLYKKNLDNKSELEVKTYYTDRDFSNKLPFEDSGIVNLDRNFSGGGFRYIENLDFFKLKNRLLFGLDFDRQDDNRIRYNNILGERDTFEIMEQALSQAKDGRVHILGEMNKALSASRSDVGKYTPKMEKINVDKKDIASVIGKGGATIREIVEKSGAKVDVNDEGVVTVAAPDEESRNIAMQMIKDITAKAELNKIYSGKVMKIMEFGAFVNFLGKQDGLVHISELADKRVGKVTDVVKEGDEVKVKVIGFDRGKVKLSMKQAND